MTLRQEITSLSDKLLGWRDISTAPKDGTWVLLYNGMTGPYIGRFDDGEWPQNGWGDKVGRWYPTPSYWMPLPEPPVGSGLILADAHSNPLPPPPSKET